MDAERAPLAPEVELEEEDGALLNESAAAAPASTRSGIRRLLPAAAAVLALCAGTALALALVPGARSSALGRFALGEEVREYSASSVPTPIAWCISGGGWRAESAAIGFGNVFNAAGLLSSEQLAVVAANSGGSWFLSLFGYSSSFYQKVTQSASNAIFDFVKTFMDGQSYAAQKGNGVKAAGSNSKIVKEADNCKKMYEQGMIQKVQYEACLAAQHHGYIWRYLVQDLLKYGVEPAENFEQLSASLYSRAGLTRPNLHFQMSELTSAYIYQQKEKKGPSDLDEAVLKKKPSSVYELSKELPQPALPLQYIVPGTDQSSTDAGFIDAEGVYYQQRVGLKPEWKDVEQPPLLFNGNPSVVDVAASSSAAAGAMGSPEMLQEVFAYNCPKFWNLAKGYLPGGLQALAVCASALYINSKGEEYCPYPGQRMADGAYLDNMATAQTVGAMQRRYGASQRLRFILTDASEKQPGKPANHLDISDLMNSDAFYSGKPGESIPPTHSFMGIRRLSPQVFDQKFEDLVWTLVPGSQESDNHNLRYAKFTTSTVENLAYGTTAGTVVDILAFITDSNVGMFDQGVSAEYAELASAIASSNMEDVVSDWLVETGGAGSSVSQPPAPPGSSSIPPAPPPAAFGDAADTMQNDDIKLSTQLDNHLNDPNLCFGKDIHICFPGDAIVEVRDRGRLPMASLRVGDALLAELPRSAGRLGFDPVIGFIHTHADGSRQEFLTVEHAQGELRASANHLVFVRPAGGGADVTRKVADLLPGDILLAAAAAGEAVRPSPVLSVGKSATATGMFAPLTASGTLVVDGVVSSCYATPSLRLQLPHGLAHALFFPARAYHALFGFPASGGRQEILGASAKEEYHPLAKFYEFLQLHRLLQAS